MSKMYIMILGMSIMSYILRFLPFKIAAKLKFSKRITLFLKCVPFAAITSLVFPDVLKSIPDNNLASLVGTFMALLLSFFFKNCLWAVAGSISVVYLILAYF